LTQVRRSLANYIQQAASNFEGRGKAPYVSFSRPAPQRARQAAAVPSSGIQIVTEQGIKKIIVDDTIPEKDPIPASDPKKKPVALTKLKYRPYQEFFEQAALNARLFCVYQWLGCLPPACDSGSILVKLTTVEYQRPAIRSRSSRHARFSR